MRSDLNIAYLGFWMRDQRLYSLHSWSYTESTRPLKDFALYYQCGKCAQGQHTVRCKRPCSCFLQISQSPSQHRFHQLGYKKEPAKNK